MLNVLNYFRLHPGYYQAMNNLANLLKDQSRFSEAEMNLRNALKLKYFRCTLT